MPKTQKNKTPVSCETAQIAAFGITLQGRRTELGKSLADIEQASGVSYVTISKLERGLLPNVSLQTLNVVAAAVGLKLTLSLTKDKSGK